MSAKSELRTLVEKLQRRNEDLTAIIDTTRTARNVAESEREAFRARFRRAEVFIFRKGLADEYAINGITEAGRSDILQQQVDLYGQALRSIAHGYSSDLLSAKNTAEKALAG